MLNHNDCDKIDSYDTVCIDCEVDYDDFNDHTRFFYCVQCSLSLFQM